MSDSHTAARGENNAAAAACAMVSCAGDFLQRQRVHVGQIHRDVDHAHREHAQNHGQRHIPSRFFHFARDPGDVDPSVIGPEDRDQSHAQRRDQLCRSRVPCVKADTVRVKVGPVAFADGESQDHECRHRRELRPCGNVLQQCAPAQANDVDVRQNRNQDKPEQMCPRDARLPTANTT